MKNSRYVAAFILGQVLDGKSLNEVLAPVNLAKLEKRDQGFVKAVCFGVCRRFYSLAAALDRLLQKPFKEKDNDIYALLLAGLYQLAYMQVAPHAAVGETVDAVEAFKKPWAKGLVNAVLRQFQREENLLSQVQAATDEAEFEHPNWLIQRIYAAWPEYTQSILQANNQQAGLTLRVNEQKISRDDYLAMLAEHDMPAVNTQFSPVGVLVETAVDVHELPGFAQGLVSVQDESAQLAVSMLELAPGQRVLDACAAPGGKTAHIMESEAKLASVVALDISAKRLESVKQNLTRLNLVATCMTGDAADTQAWFDGEPFDRILLDAPCSATGVIRRHPDIKLLRMDEDIEALAEKQSQLLAALWPLLKIGGMLVYATCSIFPDENAKVIDQFLKTTSDAKEVEIDAPWGVACAHGKQILPSEQGLDGFYYARLQKV